MPGLLQITTFGGLSIQLEGQPVTGFASRKAEALLVYLTCTARAQRRETLAELFWDERSQARAMGNLRVMLASLRKEMGDFVIISRDTVAMETGAEIWLDAAELEAALSAVGDQGAIRSGELAARVERATMELYRGEFLEGFHVSGSRGFQEWTSRQREWFQRLAVDGLYALVNYDLASGAHQAGLRHAARLLELDPLMDAAHRSMMQLLAYCGQREAALAQYEACRLILEDELGIQPAEETVRLYEQIRAGELETPKVSAVLEIEVAARLPAFLSAESEVEFQPPLFVAREVQLERLEGFLDKALDGEGSLAFVTGGPGRGKTALLEAFSRRAMDAHPDLLVASGACNQYAGIGDPYLPWREITNMLTGDVEARWAAGAITTEHARRLWAAFPSLAQALLAHGPHLLESLVPGEALLGRAATALPEGGDLLETLRERVGRQRTGSEGLEQSYIFEQFSNLLRAVADQHPLLLILDDLQWADASSISLLFHLGRRLKRSRTLIVGTYRPEEMALGRDGERHPLEKVLAELKRQYGDISIDLASVEELEGRHFVDELLDSEPNHLEQEFRDALYRRTGGQPLFTIELLHAMQARGDLLQDERGRWIAGSSLDWERLPARVEAVIEERIARLEDELRQILAVASVEGEDFTAQVVANVQKIDERQLLRLLSGELQKRHRLVREVGGLAVGQRILSRYRFAHALFQRYLYNGLGQGERLLLHRQVAGVLEALYAGQVAEIAEQLAFHYAGDPDRERHYARLAGERAAKRYANTEALRYFSRALALTPEDDLPGHFDLLLAREAVLDMQGERQTQRHDLEALERLAETMDDDHKRLQVAFRWAQYAQGIRDFPSIVQHARQGIRLAKASQDVDGQAEGYMYWGWVLVMQGDFKAAHEKLEQALELVRRADLRKIEADILRFIGKRSNYREGRRNAELALQIYRQIGDQRGEAWTLNNLGVHAGDSGDFSNAIIYLEGALAINQRIGNRASVGFEMNNLAYLYLALGNFSQAQAFVESGYQICRETGDLIGECGSLELLGRIYVSQGDYLRAKEYFDQAFKINRELGLRETESTLLFLSSMVYHHMGNNQAALAYAQEALRLADEIDESINQADAWTALGLIYESLSDLDMAASAFHKAITLREASNQPHLVSENLAGLARLCLADEDLPQALIHVEKILSYRNEHLADQAALADIEGISPDPFDGSQEQLKIYLTCYRVLDAAQDPRADNILFSAYNLLRARAAGIEDDERRHSFLKNVPSNRELLRSWAEREAT